MSIASCERPETVNTDAPTTATAGAPGPRGRPSWSGLLRLSLVAVPVKAYPALSTAGAIHCNQLHRDCGQRIHYQKHCPAHGLVEISDIVRGYPYAPDQYVVVEPDELEKTRPAKDKALVLEHFLAANQIDPAFFAGRSLYLLPDGVAAHHPYGVVAQALRHGGQWALGRVVLSTNRHLVAVRPLQRLLVMDVLHFPAQVRAASAWDGELPGISASAEELRLTSTLIDAASGPIDWSRYRDVSNDELTTLIEAKIAGRPLAAAAEEPVTVLQLLDALKQSVAAVQADAPTEKAKPRKPRAQRRAG
jgi:DNA end-binding protein Ku